MAADFNQWRNWAISNSIHENVLGFMASTTGQHLYSDPTDEYGNFPTPRGWTMVSRLLKNGITDRNAIEGAIGKAAANWFLQYCKEVEIMPDIDKLLEGKDTYQDGPNKLSLTYAIVSNILFRSIKTPTIIGKAVKAISNVRPEIASLYFGGIMSQNNDKYMLAIMKAPEAKEWIAKHRGLLLPFDVK
jgi:hypothetical protein